MPSKSVKLTGVDKGYEKPLECFTAEFALKDGQIAVVNWVDGPPYLSIYYKESKKIRKLKETP